MDVAAELLEQRDKKLIDVARSVGYESDAAFCKAFTHAPFRSCHRMVIRRHNDRTLPYP
jgi:AraC-like DNA-binding protein